MELQDGSSVVVDEAYLRESILTSQAKIVKGFQPLMPTFQGLVSEENLVALIEHVKSMSPNATTAASADARVGQQRAGRFEGARNTGREEVSHARHTQDSRASLPEQRPRPEVVVADQGPQADRDHVFDLDLGDVPARRPVRDGHPSRAGDAAGRLRLGRHLQQVLHDARRDHGVLLPDPVDSGGARQLPDPADDRRQGPGVPAHQPAQPLHLLDRRRLHARRDDQRRRRHRLDVLHAV